MKKGYHSKQDKTFGTIPRSEFLGVALGYALGMIVQGIVKLDGSSLAIVGAVIGFGIGYLIDRKFYWEKDLPEQEPAEAARLDAEGGGPEDAIEE